jgi:hypothetical protein
MAHCPGGSPKGRTLLVDVPLILTISSQSGAMTGASSIYILIAYMFAVRTWQEGHSSREGGPIWRAVGLLLCAIWPILIALVGFEALRRRDNGK